MIFVIYRIIDDRWQLIGLFNDSQLANNELTKLNAILTEYKSNRPEYPELTDSITMEEYEKLETDYYNNINWTLEDTLSYFIKEYEMNKII